MDLVPGDCCRSVRPFRIRLENGFPACSSVFLEDAFEARAGEVFLTVGQNRKIVLLIFRNRLDRDTLKIVKFVVCIKYVF